MKSRILSILVIMNILSCFFFMPTIQAATLEEQKQENQAKQEEAQKELEYVEEELSAAVVKIQELDDTIRESEKQIEQMDTKLVELEEKVTNTSKELETVQQTYEQNQKIMEKRLVMMYECGNVSYLDLLLHSSSLIEFLSNYYFIEEVVKSDNALLESIGTEKEQI